MIARASGLGIGEGRFSGGLGRVALLSMPDAELDTTRPVESVWNIPLGDGEL